MTRRRMDVKARAAGAILAAVFVAGPGLAQYEDEKGAEPFSVSVNVMGEYTDNRDSVPDGESNFDLYLQPRLDAVGSWEQGYVNLYYQPSYRYRSDPSPTQNDSELFHDAGVDLEHKATELLTLRLKDHFSLTDDPSVQKGGATVRADSSFIYNVLEVGSTVGFDRRTWLDIYGRSMVKRYSEDEVAQNSDEDSLGAGAQFWRRMPQQTLVGLSTEWTAYSYENSADVDRGFTTVFAGAGAEGDLSKQLRVAAKLGWQGVSYEDEAIDDQSLPMVSLRMRAGAEDGSRLIAAVGYAMRSSDVYPYASQKSTDVSVRAEWEAIPESLMVGLMGAYQLGEYEADTVPAAIRSPGTFGDGDRKVLSGAIDLSYLLGDKATTLKLSQRYDDVNSDVDSSFTKNTTRLMVSRQF